MATDSYKQPVTTAPPVELPARLLVPKATIGAAPDALADKAVGNDVLASPFAKPSVVVPSLQTLSPPVTVNANTTADALQVTQTGTGRAVSGTINNAGSAVSAVRGTTNGSGGGINGVNTGTTGSAGKFQNLNTGSYVPALTATTTGTGSAVLAIISNAAATNAAAIVGENDVSNVHGTGIAGYGGNTGVFGFGSGAGVSGYSTAGNAVWGNSPSGTAIHGVGSSGIGVWAESQDSIAVYATTKNASAVMGFTDQGANGVYGYTAKSDGAGVHGRTSDGSGVLGESTNGVGVTGRSTNSWAGYFWGNLGVVGDLWVRGTKYTSDRAEKQNFVPVQGAEVLDRIDAMPISSWDYKTAPTVRHIGPMAQDFHAAFSLGSDDKHIDVVDGIGVSLAAVQELHRQLKERDAVAVAQQARIGEQQAHIDALEASKQAVDAQLAALSRTIDARLAALEQRPGGLTTASVQP